MYNNVVRNNIDDALPSLCSLVLRGQEFRSRAGATKDLTHFAVTLLRPWEREILLPERKHNIAAQIAETMWVLSGRDDVAWLERYLPRARDFSDDGFVWRGAYGKRLRRWPRRNGGDDVIDQVAHVIRLLQEDNNSRRAVISIYDPEVDTADGKDIPCNDFLTFSIRNGNLDVGVTIRSNDLMWGWSGINAFEWSALQEIIAGVLGVGVGALHFSITSLHLYEQHWKRAEDLANSSANKHPRSTFRFRLHKENRHLDHVDGLIELWMQIEEDIRNGSPHADGLVDTFPEPMLQSWLRILQWWWSGDQNYLKPLEGTRLRASAMVAMQPKRPPLNLEAPPLNDTVVAPESFVKYVTDLHTEKHAAYGDSWKRRGEMLGIMANIARKIDRLGSNTTTADESAADTAIDLLVYLAKYRFWLREETVAPNPSVAGVQEVLGSDTDPSTTNRLIRALGRVYAEDETISNESLESILTKQFDLLEQEVMKGSRTRYQIVDGMLRLAFQLARSLWVAEA